MGPVRGGLIALLASATPGAAAVCRQLRPGWTPEDGPATALTEALVLLFAPWPILTIVVILLAFATRRVVFGHVALALAISLVVVLVIVPYVTGSETQALAREEGCVGPTYLRYVVGGLILVAAVAAMVRNLRAAKKT